MKADYYRYIAEFRSGDEKSKAAEEARKAYADAAKVANDDLAVTCFFFANLMIVIFISDRNTSHSPTLKMKHDIDKMATSMMFSLSISLKTSQTCNNISQQTLGMCSLLVQTVKK